MKQTTTIEAQLSAIGLSHKAAQIYAAVFELGIAFPYKIAEQTRLNRSTVYKILTDLSIKGLITAIERKGKLCYQIEKPAKLLNFAQTQVRLAEERVERTQKLLPELEGLFALTPNKPRVRFFEGIEGILSVYEEHVAETEPYEMLSYSNVEELLKQLPKPFVSKYVRHKEKVGITTRAIFPDTAFSKKYNVTVYTNLPKKVQIQSKYIPTESFPFQADVTLFGENKISFINFRNDVLMGVIIEDDTISGVMRMGFELAWKGIPGRAVSLVKFRPD